MSHGQARARCARRGERRDRPPGEAWRAGEPGAARRGHWCTGRDPADPVRQWSGAETQKPRAGGPWRAPLLGPRWSVLGL
ncbi:hypothetical protein NDU88_004580 [Pleurodeles waltl]|uniref:Uncharacterized protein n=1 Tax=Pleurodeles waltl TaxID=8319 RepID=A0AAV7W8N5_PLEWA|nr:hypothetical protein NDU88_004580 [Pleurodeles waltl]